jgi:hypothetical protein
MQAFEHTHTSIYKTYMFRVSRSTVLIKRTLHCGHEYKSVNPVKPKRGERYCFWARKSILLVGSQKMPAHPHTDTVVMYLKLQRDSGWHPSAIKRSGVCWSRPTFQRWVLPPSSRPYFNETTRRYIPEGCLHSPPWESEISHRQQNFLFHINVKMMIWWIK